MSAIGKIVNELIINFIPPVYNVSWTESGDGQVHGFWLIPDSEGFFNSGTDVPSLGAAIAGISGFSDVSITEFSETETSVYP